jgi:DNA-binding NtrC family response regulator
MKKAKRPVSVLLVEDEVLIREVLVEAFANAGFGVLEADAADAAVNALIEDSTIRAVISDVHIPGPMDGVGLAGWMKEHAPTVPIVLISGFPFASKLAYVNPAIAIIVKKPFDPLEVVEWVSSLIEGAESRLQN